MELDHRGKSITLTFHSEEDAQGFFAVLNNDPKSVTQNNFERGQYMYSWLYAQVQKLAHSYATEGNEHTQSSHQNDPPIPPKKGKRR